MQAIRRTYAYYRSRFVRGSFGHNVLIMFTGTAIGQFASILLAPLLTRIYSPEEYGLLSMFTASLTILAVVASLRYEFALPLAKTEDDAANLLAVCFTVLFGVTLLGFFLVWFLPLVEHTPTPFGQLTPYRWLLPVGLLALGAYQIMIYYATRQGAFGIIARTKIFQGASGPLTQIAFGISSFGVWGLMLGFIIGQSTGVTLMISHLVSAPKSLKHVTIAGMRAMAYRFRRFPKVSSWSSLLEAASSGNLMLVAIPLLYSNTVGGYVFLTERVIGRPLYMVSTSMLQVYLGDVSKSLGRDAAAVKRRFLSLAGQQVMIVSAWLLVVNIAASYMFPILFGKEWLAAVPYLHVLSIAYLPQLVVHALIHTLQILERQGLSAAWEVGRLIALLCSFIIGYILDFSALQALLVYSLVQATAQIILFFLMYRSIQSIQQEYSHEIA